MYLRRVQLVSVFIYFVVVALLPSVLCNVGRVFCSSEFPFGRFIQSKQGKLIFRFSYSSRSFLAFSHRLLHQFSARKLLFRLSFFLFDAFSRIHIHFLAPRSFSLCGCSQIAASLANESLCQCIYIYCKCFIHSISNSNRKILYWLCWAGTQKLLKWKIQQNLIDSVQVQLK